MKIKAKHIAQVLLVAVGLTGMVSCEDMLDTESSSHVFDKDNQLNTPNDSLYSAMGVLSQMQKLGERYVLMGELRGDLMTVSDEASVSLQEISNFKMTRDNEYSVKRDFYSVINNCNYAIARMDTALEIHSTKVMMPEYVAIKTMRAWTYFQLGLMYGSVAYVDTPILNLEDSEKDYPVLDVDVIVDRLIDDLQPYSDVDVPSYGNVDGLNSEHFFMPVRMMLGDLYLYKNQYEMAAQMYYDLMDKNNLICNAGYANTWTSSVCEATNEGNVLSYKNEVIAEIPYSSDARKDHSNLVNLTYHSQPQLLPAQWFVNELNTKTHYHMDKIDGNAIGGYLEGDTRGCFKYRDGKREDPSAYGNINIGTSVNKPLITKFFNNAVMVSGTTVKPNPDNKLLTTVYLAREIALARIPQLYLRYAEAVNRAGKPSVAFAALKYGLRQAVLSDSELVNQGELAGGERWLDFSSTKFDNNYGTAIRGRGFGIARETKDFIIPDFTQADENAARQDSINWVELQILDEMAAETAFEGSRFFDLLCISRHRANHPEFLAEKISARFENKDAAKAVLMNKENWWLK